MKYLWFCVCVCVCVCVQGAVLINGNEAKLVERFLTFKEGVAYGIDQLLEPPGLGAHCDKLENKITSVSSANIRGSSFTATSAVQGECPHKGLKPVGNNA